mmetsp:Transcript_5945/g.36829  ORF Transcript_5945/g.36829 Transcript_5945/m.36829 type:complete len:567 (+) Transcript_5945:3033-4733(+)
MEDDSLKPFLVAAESYPLPEGELDAHGTTFLSCKHADKSAGTHVALGWTPSYGTAGFRANSAWLPSTVFRCGGLMALRAMQTGKATGIVITASHNPEQDNGVKLIDPNGGMMDMEWEKYANDLAKAKDSQGMSTCIRKLFKEEGVLLGNHGKACVYIARDTRPSGEELVKAAVAGVTAFSVQVCRLGILTTPQAHFIVQSANMGRSTSEKTYFEQLTSGANGLIEDRSTRTEMEPLLVDCANGVGALKLKELMEGLAGISVRLCNVGHGALNHLVGADYVQKERVIPLGMSEEDAQGRCASIDGDADRLVYFTRAANGKLELFDGDKIATLAAIFIKDLIAELPPVLQRESSVGVVQTAYANGASTHFMKESLSLDVALTPTGVKHLHATAEQYDIGIYFEANGHGTVLFSSNFISKMKQLGTSPARKILHLYSIINQTVGDALSGILMVEIILMLKGWSLRDWSAVYEDLPSRQLKVKVEDRTRILTSCAETRCISPPGLQEEIDKIVAQVERGRAFVRPSGTEDVVRIYAEASDQKSADWLALKIAHATHHLAGGVGPPPSCCS